METIRPPHWRRSFFTVIAGQTVSLLGSSAVQFSLIWWLASETASPMMLAFSGLMAFLPQMLLGPFAGVWIDRLKRKAVLIGADLFTGAVAAAFAALFVVMEQPPYWTACLALGLRAVGGVDNLVDWEKKSPAIDLMRYMDSSRDKEDKLFDDPRLMKTPIVRNGKAATVGYRPDIWEHWT